MTHATERRPSEHRRELPPHARAIRDEIVAPKARRILFGTKRATGIFNLWASPTAIAHMPPRTQRGGISPVASCDQTLRSASPAVDPILL